MFTLEVLRVHPDLVSLQVFIIQCSELLVSLLRQAYFSFSSILLFLDLEETVKKYKLTLGGNSQICTLGGKLYISGRNMKYYVVNLQFFNYISSAKVKGTLYNLGKL